MHLNEVLAIRYRGFVGHTPARMAEAPVVEIDPAEFRNCLGEDFEVMDLADLPRELDLQSRLEPHGREWIKFEAPSGCISLEVRRAPGKQTAEETPGYDSPLYRLFQAVQRCHDSEFFVYHEVGDYPLVPASMFLGITLEYPEIQDWLDRMGRHRDRLEAPMLALLHWTADDPERAATLSFPENWLPLFAMQLLAYWRVPAAHLPLVDLLRSSPDVLDRILGEILTEEYHRLLSATAMAPFSDLRAIAENPENDEFARASALRAMSNLGRNGAEGEFLEWMRELASKLLVERPTSFMHCAFVCEVADANIQDLQREAEALFDEDLIDPIVITREDFELCGATHELRRQRSATLASPTDGLKRFLEMAFKSEEGELEVPAPARSSRKTGRNDPCSCGSGLKYKKCCGKT